MATDLVVPIVEFQVLREIADHEWWNPENEREAASMRWLLRRFLVVHIGKGLVVTAKGQRVAKAPDSLMQWDSVVVPAHWFDGSQ